MQGKPGMVWTVVCAAVLAVVVWFASDDAQCLPLFADRPYLPLCQ